MSLLPQTHRDLRDRALAAAREALAVSARWLHIAESRGSVAILVDARARYDQALADLFACEHAAACWRCEAPVPTHEAHICARAFRGMVYCAGCRAR